MFEFLTRFIDYPNAEIIHALQGILAGYLATRGIFKKEISDPLCALFILIGFAIYEGYERWRINDEADQDFEVFWVAAMLTGLIYTVVHFGRRIYPHIKEFFKGEPLIDITPESRR